MPIDRTGNNTQIEFTSRIHQYTLLHTLGRGPSSVVKLAEDFEGKQFALKLMPLTEIKEKGSYNAIISDIKLSQTFNHPSILKIFEYFEENDIFIVVMEYCAKGTLMRVISEQERLSENLARFYFEKLIDGIIYLHGVKIVHRQLTLESVLITEDDEVKITHFSCAHKIVQHQLLTTQCGTPIFAAPEVIKNRPYDGTKSDMWSLGVILYSMVAGQMPWTEKNPAELMNQIVSAKYQILPEFSAFLVDILTSLLVVQPELRLSATDTKVHPWIKEELVLEARTKMSKAMRVPRRSYASSMGSHQTSSADMHNSLTKGVSRMIIPQRSRKQARYIVMSQTLFK